MSKPLAVQVFEAMSCALENYRNVEAGQAIIDALLSEREAQVRAEEREKVAGVVAEVLAKWNKYVCRDERTRFKLSDMQGMMRVTALYVCSDITEALATYNDNRKG